MERRVQVEVASVGVRAALDEQLDDVDGGKNADRVSADRRAVSGASKVKRCGAVAAAGTDAEEFVNGFFDSKNLVFF